MEYGVVKMHHRGSGFFQSEVECLSKVVLATQYYKKARSGQVGNRGHLYKGRIWGSRQLRRAFILLTILRTKLPLETPFLLSQQMSHSLPLLCSASSLLPLLQLFLSPGLPFPLSLCFACSSRPFLPNSPPAVSTSLHQASALGNYSQPRIFHKIFCGCWVWTSLRGSWELAKLDFAQSSGREEGGSSWSLEGGEQLDPSTLGVGGGGLFLAAGSWQAWPGLSLQGGQWATEAGRRVNDSGQKQGDRGCPPPTLTGRKSFQGELFVRLPARPGELLLQPTGFGSLRFHFLLSLGILFYFLFNFFSDPLVVYCSILFSLDVFVLFCKNLLVDF